MLSEHSPELETRDLYLRVCKAFPWGRRSNWPYKVWRDEARRQLGMRRLQLTMSSKRRGGRRAAGRYADRDMPGQRSLFPEVLEHNPGKAPE